MGPEQGLPSYSVRGVACYHSSLSVLAILNPYLNATGFCNVGKGNVRSPGQALHHVFMASQLSLALFC